MNSLSSNSGSGVSREDQIAAVLALRVDLVALFAKAEPALTSASIGGTVDALVLPFEARIAEPPPPGPLAETGLG
jgi:hypothetical protein